MAPISLHRYSVVIVNIFVSMQKFIFKIFTPTGLCNTDFLKTGYKFKFNMTITRNQYNLYLSHYALSTSVQLNLIGTNGTIFL